MASTAADRTSGTTSRIRTAASTLYSENQSLIAEIRKAMNMMKEVAVDLERDKQNDMVKELESAVVELLEAYENTLRLSSAIQSVGEGYQPGAELIDYNKLFEDEGLKLKTKSSSVPQNHPLVRQFREAIWNVHHAGQPMPGDEQEDIIMTSNQCNILNITCPLSGKPVTELTDPVRSMECKHIYDEKSIMLYIKSQRGSARCPVAGCPKILRPDKVECDPLLAIEINEMRSMSKQTDRTEVIEDFAELDDEDYDS